MQRAHAALGEEDAGVLLEIAYLVALQAQRRVKRAQFVGVEDAVGQLMPVRALQAALNHDAPRPPDQEAARRSPQRDARGALELAPHHVGPARERYVIGVLAVRFAEDARMTMRRAPIVRRPELLEPKHAFALTGHLMGDRAADNAQPKNDNVVGPGHWFVASIHGRLKPVAAAATAIGPP